MPVSSSSTTSTTTTTVVTKQTSKQNSSLNQLSPWLVAPDTSTSSPESKTVQRKTVITTEL